MAGLPSGTVAFLFADIEESTALWERQPAAMREAFARYLALIDAAVAAYGGVRYKTVGDAIQAAFSTAAAAVLAAVDAQRALTAESWRLDSPYRVRMAVHVGEATPRAGDYLAPALNRLARLLGAGHGGQILLTVTAATLARPTLPPDVILRDLGVHHLRDLHEAEPVFQVVYPGLLTEFPPLRSLDARITNLPLQPAELVGRQTELAAIVHLLRDEEARLVTLTGPGGTGKTRLALQVATELVGAFPDGVFFIPLAAVTDATLVPGAVAAELKIRETPGQSPGEQLLTTLAGKRMLLLLDNLEQIQDVDRFIGELLAAVPTVSVLATGRAPLRLRAEREYLVAPLPLPPESLSGAADALEHDAIRLFVERARDIKPGFTLAEDDVAPVAEIVRRLDGLPLAIELAAARIRIFTPRGMLERLERRLPLLTGGARDLPARQRALRETIAWSYDLLEPEEQSLFRQLSVFSGGFTLQSAEVIATAPQPHEALTILGRLVEHSLVQVSDVTSDATRYRMLETIREYGLERLEKAGELSAARERHGETFLALAEEAASAMDKGEPNGWLERLDAEHDNLRAALTWAKDLPESDTMLRLVAALWPFWEIRGHFAEGRAWLEQTLDRGDTPPDPALATVTAGAGSIARLQGDSARAIELLNRALLLWQQLEDRRGQSHVLVSLGHVAERQGDLTGAGEYFSRSLQIGRDLGDPSLTGIALINLGIVADQQGEFAAATERYQEARAIFRRLGDRRRESIALDNLGNVARAQGDLERATRCYEDAITVSRDIGDAWGIAGTLGNLGLVAQQAGDLDRARTYFEESLASFRELGDRRGVAIALDNLGLVARAAGDLPRAARFHGEALALTQELGDRIGLAFGLEGIAIVASESGDVEQMVRLYGAADSLREAIGAPLPPENQDEFERAAATARDHLGEARYAERWRDGQILAPDDAVREALALAEIIAKKAPAPNAA